MFSAGLRTAAPRATSLVFSRSFQSTAVKAFDIPFLKKLPQPAGGIVGGANDAFVPPPASKLHSSIHWDAERVLAVSMIPLVTLPLATGALPAAADSAFAAILLGHLFVGFQSCIIDYIPIRKYGNQHNYAMYLLTAGTAIAAAGLYHIEQNEGGLVGLSKKLWADKKEN